MRIRTLLVACLIAAASILIATPAQAAPATVYIYKVYFDSPGSDRGSNSSLNAEYVVIKNGDNVSHSVSGWSVRDKAGHVYKFGSLSLGAGKQAVIHTGKGTADTTSTSTRLYWGRGWYVWNNTGDKVILRRADGSLKDTCSYSGAGSKKYVQRLAACRPPLGISWTDSCAAMDACATVGGSRPHRSRGTTTWQSWSARHHDEMECRV